MIPALNVGKGGILPGGAMGPMTDRRHDRRPQSTRRRLRRPRRATGLSRTAAAAVVAVTALMSALGTAALGRSPDRAEAATPPAWTVLPPAWAADVPLYDVAAAGPALVAVAGGAGRVALSDSGGLAWVDRSPAAQGMAADLFGIAFGDADHGVVVGAHGTVLVTSDRGVTWRTTGFSGLPPTADLRDVALRGLHGIAVGDAGTVIESTDGGESWRALTQPTTADLRHVALTADGTVVIGGAGGLVIIRRDGVTETYTLAREVSSVATASTPSWGDGAPDVVVSTGWEVYGSDGDGLTPLLEAGDEEKPPWSAAAYGVGPEAEVLLAGSSGAASFYSLLTSATRASVTGLADALVAATPGNQSVAYVLASDRRLARTLSAGRTPATLAASTTTLTAGKTVTFTCTGRVAAPGRLVLEHRPVGGAWRLADATAWTTDDWERQVTLRYAPTLTNDFRLRFAYGTGSAIVSTTRRVTVAPRLTPDALRITVRRGTTYRFKGTVYPALRGEKVRLYTDRGGGWHQIELGGVVKLADGTRWTSRAFGTPIRETYHLRARIDATSRHAMARSPVVTVVVK